MPAESSSSKKATRSSARKCFTGKYALLKLRRQPTPFSHELQECADKLKAAGAYAGAAIMDDPEYALEVAKLARDAAFNPNKRRPD